jgi:hypothetical protein
MYVNGVMSGMTAYQSAATLPIDAENIVINSE